MVARGALQPPSSAGKPAVNGRGVTECHSMKYSRSAKLGHLESRASTAFAISYIITVHCRSPRPMSQQEGITVPTAANPAPIPAATAAASEEEITSLVSAFEAHDFGSDKEFRVRLKCCKLMFRLDYPLSSKRLKAKDLLQRRLTRSLAERSGSTLHGELLPVTHALTVDKSSNRQSRSRRISNTGRARPSLSR